MENRKRIPFRNAIGMIFNYAKSRIIEQLKSVAFIIIYLVVFQTVILNVALANAFATASGIALVVFGLAFFLEGLVLGLMPLGERVGVKLPAKAGIALIAVFGLIMGFGATLAEPAISAIRMAGSTVTAWDSSLLYMILEIHTDWLVISVGIGVGIAVALGMFRFYYNLSIKPFIFTIIPTLLVLSIIFYFDDNLNKIIGLAWDCGAVTTGAVTVPLVLALGIGVSRAANKGKGSSGGFGIILMASAFPILSVMILGLILNAQTPAPVSEEDFFASANRSSSLELLKSEEKLERYAFTHGSEIGRKAYYKDLQSYQTAIKSLQNDPEAQKALLGDMSLDEWLTNRASNSEREYFSEYELNKSAMDTSPEYSSILTSQFIGGTRAVVPLSLLLLLVLIFFLREKLRNKDEVALGIVFTLIGMALLTSGIQLGLASLGGEVGSQLPKAFATEEKYDGHIVIHDFDKSLLYESISPSGEQNTYFNMTDDGIPKPVEFHPERYDENSGNYEHILTREPLFESELTGLGIALVLIFAFGMGYGATLAEPALNALGMTVENITVGTIKRKQIVQVVSIGVGLGILLGLCRILFEVPLVWLIVPLYVLLIPLTLLSEEEFTAIAWDSGGVTTGPVTVPLVLAMGLGIGSELNISDGFGVLALASAFPIITVLSYGMYIRFKQRQSLQNETNDGEDG